jgi:NAD+ diphosphatase
MKAIDIKPVFTQNVLDRMDHLRGDILSHRLNNLSAQSDRYLLISKGNILLGKATQTCFFKANELPKQLLSDALCVFLGGRNDKHYFTLDVPKLQAQEYEALPLRAFVATQSLPDEELGILAEANSLLCWHGSHGFCARCGTKSQVAYGGWRRDCPSCNTEHYPRTDPVVIMLVTHGDRCLLGRGHNFDEKRYSCLAGFMEPGETFKQAALRELFEEAGVVGESVKYIVDQPWPFPSNLMIGVHIEAKSEQLKIDHNELADAIWVDKSDVIDVFNGATDKAFILPPRLAIARDLLQWWID